MVTVANKTVAGWILRYNGMENFHTREETKDVVGVDVEPDRGDHAMSADMLDNPLLCLVWNTVFVVVLFFVHLCWFYLNHFPFFSFNS